MNNQRKIMEMAKSQIGYKEDPKTGYNKYNREYYGKDSAAAWCVTFVWWVFTHCGLAKLFYGGNKTASCGTLYNYYKSKGMTVPIDDTQYGDMVFFTFDGVEHCHMGLAEKFDGTYVYTDDGNTSDSSASNGGQVLLRKRHRKYIYGVARPYPQEKPTEEYYTVKKGDTLTKIAKNYGTTVDALMALNPQITDKNKIYVGQRIRVK